MSGLLFNDGVAATEVTTIVPVAHILLELGVTRSVKAVDQDWLAMKQPRIERAIMRYLGYDPRYHVVTEILPFDTTYRQQDPIVRDFDVRGNKLVTELYSINQSANELVLPNVPVRSITNIWEDRSAWGGQAEGDFGDGTKLVAGVDYYVDWSVEGLCKSGLVRRMFATWPSRPRTVKVEYAAGYTEEELTTGIAADIGEAVIISMQYAWARRGKKPFAAQSESLGGYSVTYASPGTDRIPKEAKRRLQPFLHYGRLL